MASLAQQLKKSARSVQGLPADVPLQFVSDANANPVPIRLIKLEPGMQMTGFGKSFLYEQADFPKPAKLCRANRAAVRRNQAEATTCVNNLLFKRTDNETRGRSP